MTAALIVAAGTTPGRVRFDPMKPVGDLSAVRRLVLVFQQAGVERIALVVGPDAEKVKKHVSRMGVVCLTNARYETDEMFDSVKIGLDYLADKCGRVQVTPVNIPLFSADTVRHLQQSDGQVVIPTHGGRAGHPVQIDASLFGQVLAYRGGGGLARALQGLAARQCFVPVDDAGVVCDVEKTDDIQPLVEAHSLNVMLPVLKVLIAKGETLYGPGPQQLLRLVDDSQSLRLACQRMGISYSKGWKMINSVEKMFGVTIVARQQGGRHGGGSAVTEKGKALIANYAAFEEELNEQANRIFDKYFGQG